MLRYLTIISAFLLPGLSYAQANQLNDSTIRSGVKNDCKNGIFTVTEEPLSLKVSTTEYADSLTSYLKARNVHLKNGVAIFVFIVTSKSEIIDLVKSTGRVPEEKLYKEAILKFSSLWSPARQNSHIVCAEAKIRVATNKDEINVKII